jgi:hypothetical protein
LILGEKLGAKQVETVSAVYKENLDFPDHFFIYKQPEGVNPWYIGYGMDGPKGCRLSLSKMLSSADFCLLFTDIINC